MPPQADYVRLSPAARLGRRLRGISLDAGLWWLLKRFISYSSGRKLHRPQRLDPRDWRAMWDNQDLSAWPSEPISGIVNLGGARFAIDRADIAPDGHVWIDGWSTAPSEASISLEGHGCRVQWRSSFRTRRPDVIEAFKLSPSGAEANFGYQVIGKLAGHSPASSRLALTVETPPASRFVVPVVLREERSASFWHSFYESVRFRGPRTAEYLETSVKVLREIRKADWQERAAAVRDAIEGQMPVLRSLKVLLVSRHFPNAAYVNLAQLAPVLDDSADFIICSIGQPAHQRANEISEHLDELHGHSVRFVNAGPGTPSSEIIEQFLASAARRGAAALIVYDDVAIAGAVQSIRDAVLSLSETGSGDLLWARESPGSDPCDLPFVRPPTSPDDLGPYWTMARRMTRGGLAAALIGPRSRDLPLIPPFEARGFALEFLAKTALKEAPIASTAMLDLVEGTGNGEALTLDMLMMVSD